MSQKNNINEPQYKQPDWAVGQNYRMSGLIEDECKHGVGHPNMEWLNMHDPDGTMGIHGCDGCCGQPDKVDNGDINSTGLTLKNGDSKSGDNRIVDANKTIDNRTPKVDISLCYRCEYRAQNKESGRQPRMECGSDSSVHTCYNYKPTRPVSLKYPTYHGEYDEMNKARLPVGGMMGARMSADSIADGEYQIVENDGVYTTFFVPEDNG